MQKGFVGEKIISILVKGKMTAYASPHDITTVRGGKTLEVKFSTLNIAVKGGKTKRWSWGRVLGMSGKKTYDRLILVGEVDEDVDYDLIYSGPYIFFDIPFKRVVDLMRPGGLIQISTNPKTARAPEARLLFGKYMISSHALQNRYGL